MTRFMDWLIIESMSSKQNCDINCADASCVQKYIDFFRTSHTAQVLWCYCKSRLMMINFRAPCLSDRQRYIGKKLFINNAWWKLTATHVLKIVMFIAPNLQCDNFIPRRGFSFFFVFFLVYLSYSHFINFIFRHCMMKILNLV